MLSVRGGQWLVLRVLIGPATTARRFLAAVLVVALLAAAGCGGTRDTSPIPPSAAGRVLYQLPDRTVELIDAKPHGRVTNLSARLGVHGTAALSLNGAWVAVTTDDGCAAVATGDFARLEKVTSNGTCVARYAESMHLSDGGDLLVFSASGGHQRDIFAVRREGPDHWGQPRDLTGSGRFAFNKLPRLNGGATEVVYDCANGPESDEGTSVCAVGTDGSAPPRTLLAAPAAGWTAFHSPAYLPGGGLVVECHRPDEELVCTVPPGGSTPHRITETGTSNDNSPCAFPDGRVASLVDTGIHTLRVTDSDGHHPITVQDKDDILDAGIYCGG